MKASAHSHIQNTGIDSSLEPTSQSTGLRGQENARKACKLVVKLAENGSLAGRAILLAGKAGSGKSALASSIAAELRISSEKSPFVALSSSEIFSLNINKSEALTQAFRRATAICISEKTKKFKGVIQSLTINEPADSISERTGSIVLKTAEHDSSFHIGDALCKALIKEGANVNDLVEILPNSSIVRVLGRVENDSKDATLAIRRPKVALPEGEIKSEEAVDYTISLHEMDVVNSNKDAFMSIFHGDTGEISTEIRKQVDAKVAEWIASKKARIVPGVVFIDEVHMLDLDCFSFLNRALESEWSPILIMASNKGLAKIRGSSIVSPHGIPVDLLDRCLIIKTEKLSQEELVGIIRERAIAEGVNKPPEEFLIKIAELASQKSLRFALQIMVLSSFVGVKNLVDGLNEALSLFVDAETSSSKMQEICLADFDEPPAKLKMTY